MNGAIYTIIHYNEAFDKWFQTSEFIDNRFKKYYYPCPTLQMTMKWLREVHSLWCEISWEGKGLWCVEVFHSWMKNLFLALLFMKLSLMKKPAKLVLNIVLKI